MKATTQTSPNNSRKSQLSHTCVYFPQYYSSHKKKHEIQVKRPASSLSKEAKSASSENSAGLSVVPMSNNQHIVELYDNISNSGDITVIDDSDLQPLAIYVMESKKRAAVQKNFDQAEDLENLLNSIKDEISARSKNAQSNLQTQKSAYETENIQFLNEEMETVHEQELQEFDNETEKIISDITENHQCEMNSLENEWENNRPIRYRKPSTALLQMKHIEKSAIIAGDIAKAREVHSDIEKQTQIELNEQIKKFNRDYCEMKKKLKEKQQKEIERVVQNREELRQIIVKKQDKDKDVYRKRLNVLNKKGSSFKQSSTVSLDSDNIIYGCSVSHIMQESNFEIDPLLPKLPEKPRPSMPSNSSDSQSVKNGNRLKSQTSNRSTLQIGNKGICKFKWILSPCKDPKYSTKIVNSSPKKNDNSKYAKKPHFSQT